MMFRSLLMTTAAATLLTTGAYAQQGSQQQSQEDQQQGEQQDSQLQIETIQSGGQTAAGQMGGQQLVVNSGDTIVIQPGQDGTFTLNFQFNQAGATGQAPAAQTGQVGTPMPADQAAVQRDQMQQADIEQLSVDALLGSNVYGVNDDNIGDVSDVLLTEGGEVDAIVVDVGGFLGMGTHPVAIGIDGLQFMVDEGRNWYVFTPFTQEQLEAQPAYNADTYAQEHDQQRMTVQN